MTQILTDDELFSMAQNVWASALGLDLERAGEHDGKVGDTAIISCVQIAGEWAGAVTVCSGHSLALKVATAMFALEPDELSDDEVRDAMGEIANMVGGNVKGVVPGSNTLTLPTVTEGAEGALSIARTTQLNRVVGALDGAPVIFTVFAKAN